LLVALGFGASSAQALGRLPFQVLMNADGSGRIFMNNGSTPSWKICRADLAGCTPFASGNFSTGSAAPGSVFWAGDDLITPVWKGNLHEVEPPSVRGRVRGNEVVTPVAGLWEGGWEDDYDELTLSICMTALGERCLQINQEGPEKRCGPEGATLIDPAFAGRYLRVVDRRYGSGTLFAGVGHPAYYPIGKIEPGATVSMAIFGRIAPARGPAGAHCGPPPLFTASISGDGSAEVTCRVLGCRATLVAHCRGRKARVERKLPPAPLWGSRPAKLRLAPALFERVEGGPISVTVRINGRAATHRTVKLGPLPVVAEYRGETDRGG
jgi:hypothetical protein